MRSEVGRTPRPDGLGLAVIVVCTACELGLQPFPTATGSLDVRPVAASIPPTHTDAEGVVRNGAQEFTITAWDQDELPAEGAHVEVCIGSCTAEDEGAEPAGSTRRGDPNALEILDGTLDTEGRGCKRESQYLARCILPSAGIATFRVASLGRANNPVSIRVRSGQVPPASSSLEVRVPVPEDARLVVDPSEPRITNRGGLAVACGGPTSCDARRGTPLSLLVDTMDPLPGSLFGAFTAPRSIDDLAEASAYFGDPGCTAPLWEGATEIVAIDPALKSSEPVTFCASAVGADYEFRARLLDVGANAAEPATTATVRVLAAVAGIEARVEGFTDGTPDRWRVRACLLDCRGLPIPGVTLAAVGGRADVTEARDGETVDLTIDESMEPGRESCLVFGVRGSDDELAGPPRVELRYSGSPTSCRLELAVEVP